MRKYNPEYIYSEFIITGRLTAQFYFLIILFLFIWEGGHPTFFNKQKWALSNKSLRTLALQGNAHYVCVNSVLLSK